jgi:hypothetical protein
MKSKFIAKPHTRIKGELEIDHKRGVIYFHTEEEETSEKYGSITILRICGLPEIKESAIDITLLPKHTHFAQLGYLITN